MNIENWTKDFDFQKFRKDCILHRIMEPYIEQQSSSSICDDKTAVNLQKRLEKHSVSLEQSLKYAKCFPSMCEKCMGLDKCIDCIINDNCIDAFIQFSTALQSTGG